jgi:hypothetical protein
MTRQFSIDVEWLPESYGPAELRKTSASIGIVIGDNVATRLDEDWSKSVQKRIRVATYPLALWIASSWWRLRWESKPYRNAPDVSWRTSHEMPGAGYGFLWPLMTFESDGEEITVTCKPSNPLSDEPIRYLADFRQTISALTFERTLDEFVNLVLARLESLEITGTDLQELWAEIQEERANPGLTHSRRLEARLGFDPDEAPEFLIQRIGELSSRAGPDAIDEIAPVCAGSQPIQTLDQIQLFSALPGVEARIAVPAPLSRELAPCPPWEKGRDLARIARKAYGFNGQPISDDRFASLLNIRTEKLQKADTVTGFNPDSRPPLGLAIRSDSDDGLKLLFRKRNRPALRFEAARFLAEQIITSKHEVWLPVTDTQTARQKAQRAFAAEFLCPFDALRDFLNGDLSPECIEDAAEYFGISELAVKSHLANHRQIPFDQVTI